VQKNREPDDTDLQETQETSTPLQTREFVVQKGKTPQAANDSLKDDDLEEGDEG
jgi:hypothetical protein